MSALVLSSSIAWANESSAPQASDVQRTLSADEVADYAAPYFAAIRACYLEYARPAKGSTGKLSITLVVHRNGNVHDIAVAAPGVRGKGFRRLDTCIRNEVLGWHFPGRRDFTTAILPYYFLYLDIPGAGPQHSCWDPRGCHKRAKPARRPTS